MARTRPSASRLNLESLQKQAKHLLRSFRTGDTAAQLRIKIHHPRPDDFSGLRHAQLVVAREYGFAGWSELRNAVEDRVDREAALVDLTHEFVDLACLTYSELEGPRRIERAMRILERYPGLVEASIFAAAAAGHVGALLRHLSADPTRASRRGGPRNWPPLLYLAYSRIPDAMPTRSALGAARVLLDHGANPNDHFFMNHSCRFTALTGVIGEGEHGTEMQPAHAHAREFAMLLLKRGADPNDAQGLYHAHFRPGNTWLELLLEQGLNSSHVMTWSGFYSMRTLDYQLCVAVARGFEDRVALLLHHGADPNAIDPHNGRSVYRNAYRDVREAIRQQLLAAGAKDDLQPGDRMRQACLAAVRRLASDVPDLSEDAQFLVSATWNGDLALVRALLDLGANPNGRVPGGATPLHMTSHHGRVELAEVLLEHGAAVEARDEIYDASPIGWANERGQLTLREHLLDRTKDVFDLAAWARSEQLARVLRANPELASARRAGGRTPLHHLEVAGTRGADAIDLLLRSGADLQAKTADGRTPLDTQTSMAAEEIARLLRERGARHACD
jgi:ankyrin repeat protein